jgi:hypothetical protein
VLSPKFYTSEVRMPLNQTILMRADIHSAVPQMR